MDRPGDQLLAGARLAEDQDGGVGAGDQFNAFHHRPQPGLHAHDRSRRWPCGPICVSNARLSASAASRRAVISRRRRSFSKATENGSSSNCTNSTWCGSKRQSGASQKDQHATMTRRIAQRAEQRIAAVPVGNHRRQRNPRIGGFGRRPSILDLALGDPAPAAPGQQRFQFGAGTIDAGIGRPSAGESNADGL